MTGRAPSDAAASEPLVLVIDDQDDIRRLYSRALEGAGFEVATSATGGEGLSCMDVRPPSLVLLDANLPDMPGEEVLRRMRGSAATAGVPVVIVTGDSQVERRIAGLGSGANDYVVKPVSMGELVARVKAQLRVRDHWLARLDSAAERRRRVAQILADIDNSEPFANVEAQLRQVLLAELALAEVTVETGGSLERDPDRMRRRGPVTTAGLGGFTIQVPLEAGGSSYAELVATTLDEPDHTLSALIDLAPQISALLHGPASREQEASRDRSEIGSLLRPGAITPVYQPIVETSTGVTVGFEGLSRFADGVRPDLRFRQASRVGLGPELEVAAMKALVGSACDLPADAWLSVNVSVQTLLTADLRPVISASGRKMVLEITEHELVSDYAAVAGAVERLGDVRLGVDDAGSGYASLRHIYELRPEMVKLDRAWIDGIHEDPVRRALVTGIATFADELGAVLVGEGVELAGERDALTELGIPLAQGYYFGRPAPAADWRS